MPPPPARRGSKLDAFAERIESWLAEYDILTAVRLHEKLQAEGFTGRYTIVREYLKRLRGRRTPQQAFQVVETPAGHQGRVRLVPLHLTRLWREGPVMGVPVELVTCSGV